MYQIFLNKLFVQRDLNFRIPKRELIFVLSNLGKASLYLRTKLRRTIERNLLFGKLKKMFRSKCRINTWFHFKYLLKKKIRSGIVYRYRCSSYNVTYYGKTLVTFIQERLNTWGSLILQENAQKTLSSVQYLTIYCSVIARNCSVIATFIILIFSWRIK